MPLQLEIVTPEGRVLEKTGDTVVLPTSMGEIGVLPGHIPLTASLEPGVLRLGTAASIETFVVSRGFALIENDRISVLTDSAINEANIDEELVEQARERAEKALAESSNLEPAEVARLESIVRFAIAQLARKKRR
jgi:F-type H+-transporting ATPase subunit epsilon